jgi:hypothetical protein
MTEVIKGKGIPKIDARLEPLVQAGVRRLTRADVEPLLTEAELKNEYRRNEYRRFVSEHKDVERDLCGLEDVGSFYNELKELVDCGWEVYSLGADEDTLYATLVTGVGRKITPLTHFITLFQKQLDEYYAAVEVYQSYLTAKKVFEDE